MYTTYSNELYSNSFIERKYDLLLLSNSTRDLLRVPYSKTKRSTTTVTKFPPLF